ncbi:MAG: sugar ABC transporter substrate-binding protein [Anaerolineae bacterium]|nr:sugar ABC transporter substrate-binding protein [Anaerolineae bacterium]MCA9886915.1 sugar ABC transporter substrate-binding protein [Anaerolineae bacterium]MCA9895144.1 sugar ABC transporter substrate-binding protein [Anaerolineae bacterium]MCB9461174.1 sugar ABC transporter substrate-binding protein [Anaerolineaceae bacterium]
MRKLIGIVLALTLAFTSVAISTAQEGLTICFGFQDLETEFWVAGHRAITQTLRDQGVEVLEFNANEDPNRQLEQVRDCIAEGVDGIIIIPQDGDSAVTIVNEAQDADTPIAVFNRPPNDRERGIIVVADNEIITEQAVEFMAQKALRQYEITQEPITPLILVGALQDTNAIGRRDGFFNVIARYNERYPGMFKEPIEVATEWDAATALANLEAAITANPDVDFIFTSSDFLFPTIRSVLEPRGMWAPTGDPNHVIMGGLDGDATACMLIDQGYVDATGVQDLFLEAELTLSGILDAIEAGDYQPNAVLPDPGFALTAANIQYQRSDMWGCVLYDEGFLDN